MMADVDAPIKIKSGRKEHHRCTYGVEISSGLHLHNGTGLTLPLPMPYSSYVTLHHPIVIEILTPTYNGILDPPDPLHQTAARSPQPFLHNTQLLPTDE